MLKEFPQFYYTVKDIVALHICRNQDFDLELYSLQHILSPLDKAAINKRKVKI